MKGKWAIPVIVSIAVMMVFSSIPSYAVPNSDNASDKAKFKIPTHAVKVAEGVYSLGKAKDVDGKAVEGFMFIDYKKGFGHNPKAPPNHGGGGNGDDKAKCFAYLKKDAKWKTVEDWKVNPTNGKGLSNTFVNNTLTVSIQKWEDASSTNILGKGEITEVILVADTVRPIDNVNEVYFADIDSPGAIAVTIVWGIFNGPPSQREIVSWDQVYDNVDFDWSGINVGVEDKMDFENIATHELGHSVGMDHPPDSCTEETMFAFAETEETKKRDLNAGDETGIDGLY